MKFLLSLSSYSAAGLAMGLGLLYPWFWILGVFGIAGLILEIVQTQKWTTRYIGTFWAWTIKSLCATSFFWSVYPIEWLPFEINELSLVLIGITWIAVSVSLGMGGIFLIGSLHILRYLGWLRKDHLVFAIPFVWLVAEIVGAHVFSIYSIGPGGSVNGLFSFGFVGYLLAEHTLLLQLARWGGVYMLIPVVVGLAAGLFYFIQRRLWLSLGAITLLLVSSSLVPFAAAQNTTVSVAVINTSYPVQELFNRTGVTELEVLKQEAFTAALSLNPDYVLWPEDARFFNRTDSGAVDQSWLSFVYDDATAIVVDSSRMPYRDASLLETVVYDMETAEYASAHKRYLVPQGEFVPYINEFMLRTVGLDALVEQLRNLVAYRVGPKTSQADFDPMYPGVLFCFEGIAPTGVRQLLAERPDVPFIAHPISHSWFHEPEAVWQQLDASLKVQAVWNDITIVSPANHAKSKVYLPTGNSYVVTPEMSGEYWEVGVVTVSVR